MDLETLEVVTGTPTVGQVFTTEQFPNETHKIRYLFEMSHGDPINFLFITSPLKKGMVVNIRGKTFTVISQYVDEEDGLVAVVE